MLESLAAFVAVSAVVICTPGPDTALTIRNTLAGGRRGGIATAGGVAIGQAIWTIAASRGVVALVSASEPAFRALKLAGAAYLVYLGAQSLRSLRRGEERIEEPKAAGSPFRQGLVTNLLNPKLAVLFTTLLPQFISHDDPATKSALLAAVFLAIGLTWLVAYTLIIGVVARSRRFRVVSEAVTGVVLIALGARLAVER